MRPTFFGIEIARSGLTYSQKGLDVTGHNISNVDTLGYTRQRLVGTAVDPYNAVTQFKPVEQGLVGHGTRVQILDQIRDKFLDRQFRTEQTAYSNWAIRTQGLGYVESLFEGDVQGTSLGDTLTSLFTAFNELTKEGNDREQRVYLQQQAIKMTDNFHLMYDRLIDLQSDHNLAVETVVNQINSISEEITLLNKSIYSYELDGQPANDLRDKRNLLLDQLSALTDIEYNETSENKMVVKIGGVELINHLGRNVLGTQAATNSIAGETDISEVVWITGPQAGNAATITGGELQGHMNLRDSTDTGTPGIPYFLNQLNKLAAAIVASVNAVHADGWTHANATGGSTKGNNFFDADPSGTGLPITAKNIVLDPAIIDNIYNIAASDSEVILGAGDPPTLQEGNQENARKLYDLINSTTIPGLDGSFKGFLNSIVLDVANTREHSKKMTATEMSLLYDVDNQRASISGVSLDEEMTNMIKYQHAYSGASRVITAMDEALDVLINRMGLVGRS